MTDGHSFITSVEENDPRTRLGTKIDHIFAAPAFQMKSATIDRGMFDGYRRIDCSDSRSEMDGAGRRTACRSGNERFSVNVPPKGDLDVYSDHWAIVAVVNRTSCAKHECNATNRLRGITDIKLPDPPQGGACGRYNTCARGARWGSTAAAAAAFPW